VLLAGVYSSSRSSPRPGTFFLTKLSSKNKTLLGSSSMSSSISASLVP
jgi:hypothetical protein